MAFSDLHCYNGSLWNSSIQNHQLAASIISYKFLIMSDSRDLGITEPGKKQNAPLPS